MWHCPFFLFCSISTNIWPQDLTVCYWLSVSRATNVWTTFVIDFLSLYLASFGSMADVLKKNQKISTLQGHLSSLLFYFWGGVEWIRTACLFWCLYVFEHVFAHAFTFDIIHFNRHVGNSDLLILQMVKTFLSNGETFSDYGKWNTHTTISSVKIHLNVPRKLKWRKTVHYLH